MEALANLGVDWKLFAAQAVNFLVLLFILRRFAYRPMLKFLDERRERIEQGLKDAEAAKTQLAEMEERKKETLSSAREEAKAVIEQAGIQAKERDAKRLRETEEKIKNLFEEGLVKISEEKRKAFSEVRQDVAQVVTVALEKILKEKVDAVKDQALIEGVVNSQFDEALKTLVVPAGSKKNSSARQNPGSFSKIRSEEKKLSAVVKHLEKMEAEKEGRFTVTVITARALDDKIKTQLKSRAAKLFPEQKIELRYEVNLDVVGGIQLRTDESMYDETLSAKLQTLKNSLLKI